MKIRVYYDIYDAQGDMVSSNERHDFEVTRVQHDNFDYLGYISRNLIDKDERAEITDYLDEEGNSWN